MNNKKFKISYGYEELVSLENFQNFKIKIDISEMESNENDYEEDFKNIQKKVFYQIDKQKNVIFKRMEFQKIYKELTSALNEIIGIFNEERQLTSSDGRKIRIKYNEVVKKFKSLKEEYTELLEKKERIEELKEHIKYTGGIIKDEFK